MWAVAVIETPDEFSIWGEHKHTLITEQAVAFCAPRGIQEIRHYTMAARSQVEEIDLWSHSPINAQYTKSV